MADVYGTAKPRKRWGRRLLITVLVLLVLLIAGLVVADRVAASTAERIIGERVAEQVANQNATSEQPEVTIEGVPFLTQVVAGNYHEIQIVLRNFSAPAENDKTIKLPVLDIRAQDVAAPLDTVRTGNGEITAGTVTGAGTIAYADLAQLIGQDGLTVQEQDGKLVATAPVTIPGLGQTLDVTAVAGFEVADGTVQVRFSDVSAAGLPNLPIVKTFINSYAQQLAYDLNVPALPLGLKVQKVEAQAEGLVVTAGANNVPLNAGGL